MKIMPQWLKRERPEEALLSDEARVRRKRFRRRGVGVAAAVLVVLLSPLVLRQLDYFRVRRVEVLGVHHIAPGALLERLGLDSTHTIWENLEPLANRVAEHPQVLSARLSRRLPGTLVLTVEENMPVALLNTAAGLEPLDRGAQVLPINPSRTPVDLPIVGKRDTLVLALLDDLRGLYPDIFARNAEERWDEGGGLRVKLSGMIVRAPADCTAERFMEIIPVEQDLARRGRRASELDLRYRNQIVARIE
jgi:cell division protein FtsQ